MLLRPEKRMVGFSLVVLCAAVASCVGAGFSPNEAAAAPSRRHAIGICAGAPQTLGVTYERSLGSHFAARVHVGSVVLFSSAGARLQWGYNKNGFQPYLFAGAAAIHSVAGDFGNPEGTAAYLWVGPGASIRGDRWIFFTEVGALLGGDDDGGLGHDWVFPFSPVVAAGIMIRV